MRLFLFNNKIEYRFFDKLFQETSDVYFKEYGKSELEAQNNRNAIENMLGANFLALVDQNHGTNVHVVDDIYHFRNEPSADASVTNLANIALGIVTADCVPVLLYCTSTNVIGAAHCGWKSARSDIIKNVVSAMKKLGAFDITAIIGPSILQSSYEVSEEFYKNFLSENNQNNVFFIPSSKNDKFLFDLPGYVMKKLRNAGVVNIIDNHNEDTYSNENKYHSRRRSFHRNEDYNGNLLSTIVIKSC